MLLIYQTLEFFPGQECFSDLDCTFLDISDILQMIKMKKCYLLQVGRVTVNFYQTLQI